MRFFIGTILLAYACIFVNLIDPDKFGPFRPAILLTMGAVGGIGWVLMTPGEKKE